MSEDQQEAFNAVSESVDKNLGKVFLLTGNAGTGKSVILKELKEKYRRRCSLTAPTGIASLNLNAQTIFKLFSINWKTNKIDKKNMRYNLRDADLVVIDECFMVGRSKFDLFMKELLELGKTVLLTGDVYQLKAINDDMIFRSEYWSNITTFELTTNHRQNNGEFLKVLNKIRIGVYDEQVFQVINSRKITPPEDIMHLFAYRANVDRHNRKMMRKLETEKFESFSEVVDKKNEYVKHNQIIDQHKFPAVLDYCVGAKIVTLENDLDGYYVNGSLGSIIECDESKIVVKIDKNGIIVTFEKEMIDVEDGDQNLIMRFKQFKLALAYALTIHKSQSLTLESALVDVGAQFDPALVYVGLSRLSSLDGLYITGNMKPSVVDADIRKFVECGYKNPNLLF